MIIVCPSCQARYRFDETKLGSRPRARTRCAKCGGSIDIENPLVGSATLPPTAAPVTTPVPEPPPPPPPVHHEKPTDRAQLKTAVMRSGSAADVGSGTLAGRDLHQMGVIELPRDRRFSLAVIQGSATGQIFQISKTRTTLGRSGADINLDDPECSRQHAVLEILGEQAIIRDQGSTNGTFVDTDRIESAELTNQMEFRIGSHVLMFIVTEVE